MEPELRDLIVATHQDMKWVKGKLNIFCKTQEDYKKETDKQISKLDTRVDKLETFKDRIYVLLALAGTGIGGAWMKLTKMF